MTHLLVLEDDAATREVVGEVLAHEGYTVSLAETLDDARAVFDREPCDLVLADLLRPANLPHADAARRLHAAFGATPLIIMSAYGEVRQWVPEQLGLAAVVVKPFGLDEFLSTIRAHTPTTTDA
jgi:DNA-binding response OmpR family regulator